MTAQNPASSDGELVTIERCAKVADAFKGQAARDRAKKPKPFGGWSDEVFVEERGENIAAECIAAEIRALASAPRPDAAPIDMLLFCPACGKQHIDAPDGRTPDWKNPPHKSHLCHFCKAIWRPADVPTNGVEKIETRGKADTWTAPLTGMSAPARPDADAKLAKIRERHAIYSDDETSSSFFDPDGYKAHMDRAYLLSLTERAASLETNYNRAVDALLAEQTAPVTVPEVSITKI